MSNMRIINSVLEKNQFSLEAIPGVEIKIIRKSNLQRDFLVMSSGVIYSRPIFYSNKTNDKWKYIHDDAIIPVLIKDKDFSHLIDRFKLLALETTSRHLREYTNLFPVAPKRYLDIKASIIKYKEQIATLYNKMEIGHLVNDHCLDPWI